MKRYLSIIVLLLFLQCLPSSPNAQSPAHFLSSPSLSPDAKTLVYSYAGDIWLTTLPVTNTRKLTSLAGYETNIRFAPDGNGIAFSNNQYGNYDVYYLDLTTDSITRLTMHSSDDMVFNWSWDNQTIFFGSDRYGDATSFKINKKGGNPIRLFDGHPYLHDHNIAEHPISREIFFNDSWESNAQQQRYRKGYKGAFNADILSWNTATRKFTRHTEWPGKEMDPIFDEKGTVYFLSDQQQQQYNIYKIEGILKKPLTSFTTSIRQMTISKDGNTIVFEKDYRLWTLDTKTGKSSLLDITMPTNGYLQKTKQFSTKSTITYFDISPDNKKIAFVSKGSLFCSDIDGQNITQLSEGKYARIKEVKWLNDNSTLLFNKISNGYMNWFTCLVSKTEMPKQLTFDEQDNRSIELSNDRSFGVYRKGANHIMKIDLSTFRVNTVAAEEIWSISNALPSISPDNKHIAFVANKKLESDIIIANLETGRWFNLTNSLFSEEGVSWSPDKKYIYFYSTRTRASYPNFNTNAHLYRIPLAKLDQLESASVSESKKQEIRHQLFSYTELVSKKFGTQYLSSPVQSDTGGTTRVFYFSDQAEGRNALWLNTYKKSMLQSSVKINGTDFVFDIDLVKAMDSTYVLMRNNLYRFSSSNNQLTMINLEKKINYPYKEEYENAWQELVGFISQNYYDRAANRISWLQFQKYYAGFLPYINTRNDFRTLVQDFLGESNTSHYFFNTPEDDLRPAYFDQSIETGIIFNNHQPFVVESVLPGSNAGRPDQDILPGDELVMIDSSMVDHSINRDQYFVKRSLPSSVALTFKRNGQLFTSVVGVQTSVQRNMYDAWSMKNHTTTHTKTGNTIAYLSMRDMSTAEFEQFCIASSTELDGKKGLILDLRYNMGGNIHDELIKWLSQKKYLRLGYPGFTKSDQPISAPSSIPVVVLINERTLSDAEVAAAAIKELGLATLVGTNTYGWIVYSAERAFADGSYLVNPSFGWDTFNGQDLEKTGVAPDIAVKTGFADKLNGRDPQLDKAIQLLLNKAKSTTSAKKK